MDTTDNEIMRAVRAAMSGGERGSRAGVTVFFYDDGDARARGGPHLARADVAFAVRNDGSAVLTRLRPSSTPLPAAPAATDGGKAFPSVAEGGTDSGLHAEFNRGMSLRDYLAGRALPALIASASNTQGSAWPLTMPDVVEKAYQFADAMLAERAKVQS